MRYLILSDIHGNLQALESVLAAVPDWDRLLVLGDLVGYGAQPNEVVDRIRALEPQAIVRGNHDKVAAGLENADTFNPAARGAALWTASVLSEENRAYLAGLPMGPVLVDDLVEICHGSPRDEDAYIFGEGDLAEAFASLRRPVCFFGHTHYPMAVTLTPEGELDMIRQGAGDQPAVPLEGRGRLLVNPGAVGQPRDGDPRAACALLDTGEGEVRLLRIPYPAEEAHDRILATGLPRVLAQRLLVGR
ncbi:MAG TPA: metallophosphoesterase family protein [Vicinamibacterales bacterium]|nr:metallophosphoesterase family protein [Vicinamibacterales bacterium]